MRRFHSYGPVDPKEHFFVPRQALIDHIVAQLVGGPDGQGHLFTIWAPRQSGKTWLMRRAVADIRARHGERFAVVVLSAQGRLRKDDKEEAFLPIWPGMLEEAGLPRAEAADFDAWRRQFLRHGGIFDRPVLLLIDEFDSLPPAVIDRVVGIFRAMHLSREAYVLHGLALVGVRAVLGMDSDQGSPFNVQRSFHIPNLTPDEVEELFRQYQVESGQQIEPEVVRKVFEVTRGQPGLCGWLGELLTESYNPGSGRPIAVLDWARAYDAACQVEPNNTVLNLLRKAQAPYLKEVIALFKRADVPFTIDQPWCEHLYFNGVIDHEEVLTAAGERIRVCRFSSPFIQLRLYNALSVGLVRAVDVPVLDLRDDLSDVFQPGGLNVPALLGHYRAYLVRLRQAGVDPWKGQPRRGDLHITEAVGHFHLYSWLKETIGDQCVVSPEFPTGNGKVDLLLTWGERRALIEIKSLEKRTRLGGYREQAARYAVQKGLDAATLAVFLPVADEDLQRELSGEHEVAGVRVVTVAFG